MCFLVKSGTLPLSLVSLIILILKSASGRIAVPVSYEYGIVGGDLQTAAAEPRPVVTTDANSSPSIRRSLPLVYEIGAPVSEASEKVQSILAQQQQQQQPLIFTYNEERPRVEIIKEPITYVGRHGGYTQSENKNENLIDVNKYKRFMAIVPSQDVQVENMNANSSEKPQTRLQSNDDVYIYGSIYGQKIKKGERGQPNNSDNVDAYRHYSSSNAKESINKDTRNNDDYYKYNTDKLRSTSAGYDSDNDKLTVKDDPRGDSSYYYDPYNGFVEVKQEEKAKNSGGVDSHYGLSGGDDKLLNEQAKESSKETDESDRKLNSESKREELKEKLNEGIVDGRQDIYLIEDRKLLNKTHDSNGDTIEEKNVKKKDEAEGDRDRVYVYEAAEHTTSKAEEKPTTGSYDYIYDFINEKPKQQSKEKVSDEEVYKYDSHSAYDTKKNIKQQKDDNDKEDLKRKAKRPYNHYSSLYHDDDDDDLYHYNFYVNNKPEKQGEQQYKRYAAQDNGDAKKDGNQQTPTGFVKKPSDSETQGSESIQDQQVASSKHHDHGKKYEHGGGKEHDSGHHDKHHKEDDKGNKAEHKHHKGHKGHHHKKGGHGHHHEEGGHKKKHHDDHDHEHEHHEGDKGQKGAKYEEDGKHEKGHSTKGEHKIHKKDEYDKKHEFYDEHHEGDDHDKHGGFHEDKGHGKGGHHKAHHHKGDHHEDHHGKKGHHEKGGHHHHHEGHEKSGGHEHHHSHGSKHGKKGAKSEGKKWGHSHSEKHKKGGKDRR